jgi:hypothetical protein
MTERFTVAVGDDVVSAVHYAAPGGFAVECVLGHGAGANQASPFMVGVARGLAGRGIPATTFNFVYTERRRRLPDRAPLLEACYHAVVAAVRERAPGGGDTPLVLGGKSMGGRIGTHLAADWDTRRDGPLAGVVLFGYPLHPPGRPAQLRAAHLSSIRVPLLFLQGSRDEFGTPAEIREAFPRMPPGSRLHEVEGADHSLGVAGRRTRGGGRPLDELLDLTVEWIQGVTAPGR